MSMRRREEFYPAEEVWKISSHLNQELSGKGLGAKFNQARGNTELCRAEH